MNRNTAFIALAALLAGAAIGWTAKPAADGGKNGPDREERPRRTRRAADPETRVKTMTTVITNTVVTAVTNTVSAADARPRGPGGFLAEFERMKKEDPERYATMTNRMARFRDRMTRRAENKLERLASVDTSTWNAQQIANHEKYQDLILKRHELMEILRPDSGATAEEKTAAMAEMGAMQRELRSAGARERNTLLDKTFTELGYSEADAREIRETVKTIFSTTEEWGGFGGHGAGRGPRR